MLKQTYVILRRGVEATLDNYRSKNLAGKPLSGSAPDIKVDVDAVDRKGLRSLVRDSDVIAVAPTVPMALISPVAREVAATVASMTDAIAWGVRAVGADQSPFTGKEITVAVLDTGIDASHPAFDGIAIQQVDFTGDGIDDTDGHGTHCAGTIFGRTVDGRRIGVAPGVGKALIGKVLGSKGASSDQIVQAIQWAVQEGAHVISMSLGIDFPGLVENLTASGLPAALATSRALEGYRANILLFERLASFLSARSSFSRPTLLVAAAGNESQRDIDPAFEIAVSPPAVAEGFVSVAALEQGTSGLAVAPFSNTGATVSAPGVGILSAAAGGGLTTKSGTSMAAPHVAGLAALWAEQISTHGRLTTVQLKTRLLGSCTTSGLDGASDLAAIGLGMPRAPSA